MRFVILVVLVLVASTGDALAYVGPGLGLGVIGALLSTVLAVLLAIVGVVWYPLKRILKRIRSATGRSQSDPPVDKNDKRPGP